MVLALLLGPPAEVTMYSIEPMYNKEKYALEIETHALHDACMCERKCANFVCFWVSMTHMF